MADYESSRYRKFNGWVAILWKTMLCAIPLVGILYILGFHQKLRIPLFQEQYVGLFLGLVLVAIYIGIPNGRSALQDRVPWYDWIFSILALIVGLYIALFYPELILRFGYVTPERVILSVLAFVLILEALRRIHGWTLVIVVLVFLTYAFLAPYLPGLLKGRSTPPIQLFNYLYLDTNSLLNMVGIAATMALAFVLFGQMLLKFGGGDIFNDISLALFGRFRGGPAKVAVIGSSLVGSISGGPVMNVVLTGSMTIPLMIRNGYSRHHAGAIEAVASTGGLIMPPIMGIAAFLIAERLGVPYKEVALAALIPALLYYLCLFTQVDLTAAKAQLKGLSSKELPSFFRVVTTGWVIIPVFGVLIYFLFIKGLPPATAGVYSAGLSILFLSIQQSVRNNYLQKIISLLSETGKTLLEVAIVLAAAGLIVGIVGITGLGFNLVLALTKVGEHGLFPLLVASAVIALVLGMGMPAVAAYSLVAVLIAPTLVELGVQPMAAHLFVFYFAILSNFTPPIALASFAAAPIAKASPNQISLTAMRLGVVAYIVPFIFVYSPAILIGQNYGYGSFDIFNAIISAIIACILIGISFVGYLFRPLNMVSRVILALASLVLFAPIGQSSYGWIINIASIALVGITLFNELRYGFNSLKSNKTI